MFLRFLALFEYIYMHTYVCHAMCAMTCHKRAAWHVCMPLRVPWHACHTPRMPRPRMPRPCMPRLPRPCMHGAMTLVWPPGPNKYCRRRSDSGRQGLTTTSFGSRQQQATTAMPIDDTASLFVHRTLPVVIAAHVRKSGRRQRLILN